MDKEKKWIKAPYPRNLLYAVRGWHEEEEPTELTQDVLSGIQCAVSMLNEREQFIINCRYAEGMTLRAIGEKIGVKAERTRQIEVAALRKLRSRRNLLFMTVGLMGYINEMNRIEYERGYQIGFNDGYEQGLLDAPKGVAKEGKSVSLSSLPIEALNISLRARNALAHAGFKQIGDILNLHRCEIIHIKNLGPKQREEVAEGLHYYGITETGWDFFHHRKTDIELNGGITE